MESRPVPSGTGPPRLLCLVRYRRVLDFDASDRVIRTRKSTNSRFNQSKRSILDALLQVGCASPTPVRPAERKVPIWARDEYNERGDAILLPGLPSQLFARDRANGRGRFSSTAGTEPCTPSARQVARPDYTCDHARATATWSSARACVTPCRRTSARRCHGRGHCRIRNQDWSI